MSSVEYQRQWREANREKCLASSRKWKAANPERHAAMNRKWKEANPERIKQLKRKWYVENTERSRESAKRSYFRRQYGITPEQWDELFAAQGKVCAICKTDDHNGKGWHTDHC